MHARTDTTFRLFFSSFSSSFFSLRLFLLLPLLSLSLSLSMDQLRADRSFFDEFLKFKVEKKSNCIQCHVTQVNDRIVDKRKKSYTLPFIRDENLISLMLIKDSLGLFSTFSSIAVFRREREREINIIQNILPFGYSDINHNEILSESFNLFPRSLLPHRGCFFPYFVVFNWNFDRRLYLK